MKTNRQLQQHILEQDKEIFDLIARVIEVIHTHSLWGDEDEYIFKDGETWYKFDPENEKAINVNKVEIDNE